MEQLLSKSAPVALSYLPLAPKRAGRPPIFFSFFYSSMIIGSMCAISDFLLLNEKTVEWCERTLRMVNMFSELFRLYTNIQKLMFFMKLMPCLARKWKKSGGHSANLCATAMHKLDKFVHICILGTILFGSFTIL